MQHLSVPSAETEKILQTLQSGGNLPESARVITNPDEPGHRLIPFIGILAGDLLEYQVHEIDTKPSPKSYRDHLQHILPVEIFESIDWPTRHEFIGDLILIKLDEMQRQYGTEIAQAFLHQHTRVRAVFEDRGVTGQFRVRDLFLLGVRNGENPTTHTFLTEGGHKIAVDPSKVYYSSRLSTEREGTLDCARRLSVELGRPLSICDPYAGVGPSIVPLLSESDLVGELFVNDMNPATTEFLKMNIKHPNVTIECTDARQLKQRDELSESFDLLLMNIPHDTISHLPELLPLLRKGGIVRGWAVIENSDFESASNYLTQILGHNVNVEIRRSYSATANLCRFEAKKTD